MQLYNNIVSKYSEYFFENFKGGRGGGKRKKDNNSEKQRARENITNGIFLAILAFLYYVNTFSKQSSTLSKKSEGLGYAGIGIYLAIAILAYVLLYIIISYVYNNLDTSTEYPINNK